MLIDVLLINEETDRKYYHHYVGPLPLDGVYVVFHLQQRFARNI